MDEINNQKGLSAYQILVQRKSWNFKNLENEGLRALRKGELKVLNPGLKIPKRPR